MVPWVKLGVISKMDWDTSLLGKSACFFHLLYTPVEKQPYLVSTSFYKLYVKNILFLTCI